MGLVHIIANCDHCFWHYETRNAMGLAAIHHKRTGHRVRVETGYSHVFGGTEYEPDKFKTEVNNE